MVYSSDLVDLIVKEVMASLSERTEKADPWKVVSGVSNRHIHLSREDLDELFGRGYELNKLRDLRQPGQFACQERVNIMTAGGTIEKVRVLGPVRSASQLELSASDSRRLRIKAPLVKSGVPSKCDPVVVMGPEGAVILSYGVGIAWRHVHLRPERASELGLSDGDHVSVEVGGDRGLVFNNVWVRVGDRMDDEFHLDLDEANSCGLSTGDMVRILKP